MSPTRRRRRPGPITSARKGRATSSRNHGSHSNRLVPVYAFGRKVDLGAVTGKNSLYRDPGKVKALYGFPPENTVNPDAEYADQSDLAKVQRDAVARGVKHLFIVWFDGLDWPTTQAAAIVKSGKVYHEGKGSGLIFQDYTADGTAQYGFVVTSPTHDKNTPDLDAQTVAIPARAWEAATTLGSPGRTPGRSAPWGGRPRAISRGSRPVTPTGPACGPRGESSTPTPTRPPAPPSSSAGARPTTTGSTSPTTAASCRPSSTTCRSEGGSWGP